MTKITLQEKYARIYSIQSAAELSSAESVIDSMISKKEKLNEETPDEKVHLPEMPEKE